MQIKFLPKLTLILIAILVLLTTSILLLYYIYQLHTCFGLIAPSHKTATLADSASSSKTTLTVINGGTTNISEVNITLIKPEHQSRVVLSNIQGNSGKQSAELPEELVAHYILKLEIHRINAAVKVHEFQWYRPGSMKKIQLFINDNNEVLFR